MRLFAGMTLAAMLAPLGSTMIAVALPAIGEDIGVEDAALTQWLASSYLIVALACQSPGGKLGDRFGHARVLGIGMLAYALGTSLGFVLARLEALVAARALMALGGAAIAPAAMAIINNRVRPERRAGAFGMFGAMMGVAAALGPLVGGTLVARFGWRSTFAAPLPVLAAAWFLIPRHAAVPTAGDRTAPARFDVAGSVLLALGLAFTVSAARSSVPLSLGMAGALLLIGFGLWERRVVEPVIDFALFRSRVFVAACAIVALHNLSMYALLFQLPIFFERVRGVGAAEVGASLAGLMLAMVMLSPIGGRLADVVGTRTTTLVGSGLTLLGFLMVSDFGSLGTPRDAVVALVVMGAGIGLSMAPIQASAMGAAGRERSGMAAGVMSTVRYLGGVVGISALGYFLDREVAVSIDAYASGRPLFVGALVLSVMAALMLPGRRPPSA